MLKVNFHNGQIHKNNYELLEKVEMAERRKKRKLPNLKFRFIFH